jgi:hypothetical protein
MSDVRQEQTKMSELYRFLSFLSGGDCGARRAGGRSGALVGAFGDGLSS